MKLDDEIIDLLSEEEIETDIMEASNYGMKIIK